MHRVSVNPNERNLETKDATYLPVKPNSLNPRRKRRAKIPPVYRLRSHDRPPALLATFDGKHREYSRLRERKRQLEARTTATPRIKVRHRNNNNNDRRGTDPQYRKPPRNNECRPPRTRRKRSLQLRSGAAPVARREDDERDPMNEGGYDERRDDEDGEPPRVEERSGGEDGREDERGADEVLDLLRERGERVVFAADRHFLFEGDGQRLS